jgi:hypothetical protein
MRLAIAGTVLALALCEISFEGQEARAPAAEDRTGSGTS